MSFFASADWIEWLLYTAISLTGAIYGFQVLWPVVQDHVRGRMSPEQRAAILREEYRRGMEVKSNDEE